MKKIPFMNFGVAGHKIHFHEFLMTKNYSSTRTLVKTNFVFKTMRNTSSSQPKSHFLILAALIFSTAGFLILIISAGSWVKTGKDFFSSEKKPIVMVAGDSEATTTAQSLDLSSIQCLGPDGNPAPCAGLGAENGIGTDGTIFLTNNPFDVDLTSDSGVSNADVEAETDADIGAEADFLSINADEADSLNSSANVGTGADSSNAAVSNTDNQTNVENNNNAEVINHSYLKAETGLNVASFNSGSGVITTFDANGQGELVNVINQNVVELPDASSQAAGAVNDGTGAGSDNLALTNLNNQLTVKNINNSNTVNQVEAAVNSGKNQANFNTRHGMVVTGNANLGLNYITMANTNLTGSQMFYADWQNIYSGFSGDLNLAAESAANLSPLSGLLVEASNNCTGAGSNNQAIVNVNDETQIINSNSGSIHNDIKAEVVSGENEANKNTGAGSISSGDVQSAVNVVNFLNSNVTASNWWLKSLNIFGDWNGNILLPQMPVPHLSTGPMAGVVSAGNNLTGPGSANDVFLNVNEETNITNANDAVITNNADIITDTGNNKTSYNGGSGVVRYGEAKAEMNELNVANQNITGDSWWLVVVNKFGDWSGTTIGSPEDMLVDSTGDALVLTPEGSGITVGNNATGPESNNLAGANINHTTDVNNYNEAYILNDVHVEDVSGRNETQFNTHEGYIETGDIRAATNLVNFANSNVTVGNWLVAVVNVFGNWTGNLVFDTPGINSQAISGEELIASGSNSSNAATGDASSNNAAANNSNNNNVVSNNNALANNDTSASAITGENSASYNTGHGVVSTGEANSGNSVINQINNNNIAVGGNNGGTSDAGNAETGAGSDNNAISDVANDTDIANDNNSTVNNNFGVVNSTGQNSSNYNTGSGVVDTGWADAFLGLTNQQNNTDVSLGEFIGDINDAVEAGGAVPTDDDNSLSSQGDTNNSAEYNEEADNSQNSQNDSQNNNAANQTNENYQQVVNNAENNNIVSAADNADNSLVNIPVTLPAESQRLKGDFNNDGKVDDFDFSFLMANWGKKISDDLVSIIGQGTVDDRIFSIVMSNWNKTLASMQ